MDRKSEMSTSETLQIIYKAMQTGRYVSLYQTDYSKLQSNHYFVANNCELLANGIIIGT